MPTSHPDGPAPASDDRRRFLRFLGAGTLAVGAAGTLAACDSQTNFDTPAPPPQPDPPDPDPDPAAVTFDFSNDLGPLNYAYALEQLEGAFYGLVIGLDNFSSLFPDSNERNLLRDLAGHEGVHRDFLRAAITAANSSALIPDLTPNLDAFDLSSRESILTLALTFEDLGVAAYNGAGRYIANDSYLTIAGKIVSVEARHAAAIATALNGSSDIPKLGAAGVINPDNGLDRAFAPDTVLNAAQDFVQNDLSAINF
jgi:hypothetical protein